MTTTPKSIVVVGASAAGLTAAESLRREGFTGSLTLVGDETHAPYDRPPLSKQVLKGDWPAERTFLRKPEAVERLGAAWRLGVSALSLDVEARRLGLSDGSEIGYDGLVIATGVAPRHLPGDNDLANVHVLRTVDDARALRHDLLSARRLAVVGAGFLGSEVAAVAREMDVEVTVVDPLEAPMIRQLGPTVGDLVAQLHRARGVDLRLGVGVRGLTGERGVVTGIDLTDGSHVTADVVLVAVGSVPNTAWLADTGLDLANGVVCDAHCRAADGVVAAGDVASWFHQGIGRQVRLEHRMNAVEQGGAAARALLDEELAPFVPVPFFWSDQYDVKIQVYGLPHPDDDIKLLAGSLTGDRFALSYVRNGQEVAGLAWNLPKEALAVRARLAALYQ